MPEQLASNSDSRGDESIAAQVQPILAEQADGVELLLTRPISLVLPDDPQARDRIARQCRGQNLLLESLGQLLAAEHPPLELLIMTRDFAKRHLATATSPLPPLATRVLYLAAIAVARVRCQVAISSLPHDELSRQVSWVLALRGVPQNLREIFKQMQGQLISGEFGSQKYEQDLFTAAVE